MDARFDFFNQPAIARNLRQLTSAGHLPDSILPAATQELCRLRASQINGCGFCTDMHTKDALAAGEDAQRLSLVAAWREATVFTDAERAALEITEQGTRIADAAGGVSREAWLDAAKHYDEGQLAALTLLIATINAFNRLNVINQQPAGGYVPGQFAG
jgi:AhpD family alkylhydroperoxidase